MQANSAHHEFKKIAALVGLTVSPHDMRRYFAIRWITEHPGRLLELQKQMGHADMVDLCERFDNSPPTSVKPASDMLRLTSAYLYNAIRYVCKVVGKWGFTACLLISDTIFKNLGITQLKDIPRDLTGLAAVHDF